MTDELKKFLDNLETPVIPVYMKVHPHSVESDIWSCGDELHPPITRIIVFCNLEAVDQSAHNRHINQRLYEGSGQTRLPLSAITSVV